ncbi:membrane protein [Xenorhabdus miraniensis]|uniref:Membrane protein n=2 Tax=Xenorhabdus miraniensis TaxID=351674 RepID=A0A2D0JQ18_9GAMM|nr:membrane protein [Xenorhabdus miraniensis]
MWVADMLTLKMVKLSIRSRFLQHFSTNKWVSIMNIIKQILIQDLERINLKEHRDGKVHFNSIFIHHHPYLCLAMVIAYAFLATLMWYAPYFGAWSIFAFTVAFIAMAAVLLFDIKPVYHFEDIDVLDLRVCYNGEWFVNEQVSKNAINRILNHPRVPNEIKDDIKHIMKKKHGICFYDVFMLACSEQSPYAQPLNMANKSA